MDIEILMTGLLVVSVLTSLTVEAIKKLTSNKKHNIAAVIVAVILSLAISVGYMICTATPFTLQMGVEIVALVFLSFLSSTVGYDKVIQTINQLKGV